MVDRKLFSEALTAAHRELGLAQPAFAKRLGVSPRTLSRWEHGVTVPSENRRKRVLASLANLPRPTYAHLAKSLGYAVPDTAPSLDAASLRRVLDDAVRVAAEDLDVGAKRFRAAVDTVLAALDANAVGVKQARELIATPRERRGS